MFDELSTYLGAAARDECYRVEKVLKESTGEITELVYFTAADDGEKGPYVRKRFSEESPLGSAYERIWQGMRQGTTFHHMPSIIDCYKTGSTLTVISQYIQGETLDETVRNSCKESCDELLLLSEKLFPQICDAASELHERFDPPLIHRDLKPSNIMIAGSRAFLIDFGIARSFNSEAQNDTQCFGTRSYAPPEQFGFQQTDTRSDIYALGMLLFFCLTGENPDATTHANKFCHPAVPEELRAVIEKASAFDPANRYASAKDLKNAFLNALVSISQTAGSAQKQSSLTRVSKSLGIVWNIVLLIFLVLSFAAITNMVFNPSPQEALATAPLALRAAFDYSVFICMFIPVFYICSNRGSLKKRMKILRNITLKQELIACAALIIVGLLIAVALTALAGNS